MKSKHPFYDSNFLSELKDDHYSRSQNQCFCNTLIDIIIAVEGMSGYIGR